MKRYASSTWKVSKHRKLADGSKSAHVMDGDESDEDNTAPNIPLLFGKGASSSVYSQYNHVYFNDDISYDTVFALNKELRQVETRLKTTSAALGMKETQPIYLHITTHGGGIHAAFSVVDCIQQLSVPVYTVVDGFVASAGTLITLAGKKKFMTANAYMLIHELRSGVWGKMSSIDEEYLNLKKVMDHITEYYTKHTLMTKKQLAGILSKDIIWNTDECIKKGLVDDVYVSQ